MIKNMILKRPMNTIGAIATSLGAIAALLTHSGEPFSDFLQGFMAGYTADSVVNRPG